MPGRRQTEMLAAAQVLCKCRQDIKLDIYDWKEAEGQLETKWRVSGIVQLPWKPLLAAAGGTTHVFSQVVSTGSAHDRYCLHLLQYFWQRPRLVSVCCSLLQIAASWLVQLPQACQGLNPIRSLVEAFAHTCNLALCLHVVSLISTWAEFKRVSKLCMGVHRRQGE